MGKIVGFVITLVFLANVSLADPPHHRHHHHHHHHHRPHG